MSDNSRVRVSIVGVVIVALFASLFARLWFLQMGPEQKLGRVVSSLATRVIQTESPRGEILDRNGKVLAHDVAAWAVTVDRNLSASTRDRVLGQLAEVLGIKEKVLRANYDSVRQSPLAPAVVALRVPLSQQLAIREHSEDYPGVHVMELTIRSYPYDGLASQLLGYLGEVDAFGAKEFKQLQAKGYQPGDLIGRDGVEAAYESVLRGKPRRETVQVDPTGKQVGPPIKVDPGSPGDNVKLTIDIKVQKAAEDALAEGINAAKTLKNTNITDQLRDAEADGRRGGGARRARRIGRRDGEQSHVSAVVVGRRYLDRPLRLPQCAGCAEPAPQPRHPRSVRTGIDVQAGDGDRAEHLQRVARVAVRHRQRRAGRQRVPVPERQQGSERPGQPPAAR